MINIDLNVCANMSLYLEDCFNYCEKMNSMNENIRPYQSCSKSVFLVLGIIFISWMSLFSVFLIMQGAWPVSIFLGLEYLIIFYLIRLYFKEKNIKDEINIDQKEISIKKYKGDKLLHSSKFNTYWSKVLDRTKKLTSRKKGDIGFSVTRGGEIAGEHTVSFIGTNDRVDLVHKANNRSIFVDGAIEAAIFISKKKTGLFNMNDLLF